MKPIHNRVLLILIIFSTSLFSCKKYLDEKPLKSLAVPSSLADLQKLLDAVPNINTQTPAIHELVSDNIYLFATTWQAYFNNDQRMNYIWDKDAMELTNWSRTYGGPIYYANNVLDVLPGIEVAPAEQELAGKIKGAALFYRAFAFERLAQLYCDPFSTESATKPGIVLRTTSAIETPSVRSTVKGTYDKIINDLNEAVNYLPETEITPMRPTKAAAFGLLARAYLAMRDYPNAARFADSCLNRRSDLLDYNSLVPVSNTNSAPMPLFDSNPEIIYYSTSIPMGLLSISNAKVDTVLYNSYHGDDLRKSVFFRPNTGSNAGTFGFRGAYHRSTNGSLFNGIATDEMYLIRAECRARAGAKDNALNDLDILLLKRWKNGFFIPSSASTQDEALTKILIERRKELVYRGLRWSDMRRLNLENANITLVRDINGTQYTLPHGDLRWTLLIPQEVINLSGIQQNPR